MSQSGRFLPAHRLPCLPLPALPSAASLCFRLHLILTIRSAPDHPSSRILAPAITAMAEKFSKFRDPGTGIQVFLTPVAASISSSPGASGSALGVAGLILTPVFVLLGCMRAIVGGLFWGGYLVSGSAGLLRVVLGSLGFSSLAVETVSPGGSGRRGGSKQVAALDADKGDLVLANHSSWIDLLILSYLYPGIQFVVPVIADADRDAAVRQDPAASGTPSKRTPKKNAMSANTRIVTPSSPSSASSSAATEIAIHGFAVLPLTAALRFIGSLPPSASQVSSKAIQPNLDAVIKSATGVLALFPEVVTSNNRALLNISPSIVPSSAPPSLKATHVVTIKYAPPTPTSTTSVYSVPAPTNPFWKHLVDILFLSSPVRAVNVRQTQLAKDAAGGGGWAEQVAALMSSLARLKRTSITWSAKKEFLAMVQARNKRV